MLIQIGLNVGGKKELRNDMHQDVWANKSNK